ncbi:MAG: hypothetical protein KL787_04145 [Taibaiella sp.]|nr:hypothetical protein [Taibaiella sp.]
MRKRSGTWQMVLYQEWEACDSRYTDTTYTDTFTITFNDDHSGVATGRQDTSSFSWNVRETNKQTNPSGYVIELNNLTLHAPTVTSFEIFYILESEDNYEKWYWPGDCLFSSHKRNKYVYLTRIVD